MGAKRYKDESDFFEDLQTVSPRVEFKLKPMVELRFCEGDRWIKVKKLKRDLRLPDITEVQVSET